MTPDPISSTTAGDISILYPRLTHLRELVIQTGYLSLGKIDLPALDTFSLSVRPSPEVLESIATARWPKLESLSLSFCDLRADDVPFKRINALLDALPPLTHLGIAAHSVGDELLAALSAWKHLPKLESLDLSGTAISNTGAKVLLTNAKRFEHLESFDLSENELSSKTCKALEKAFGDAVDTEGQGERARYDGFSE
jgi:hypothetical protein